MSEYSRNRNDRHSDSLILRVNMGEGLVAVAPHVIVCTGLGSCVALVLYEKNRKIGGLAHIMLPDSSAYRSPSAIPKPLSQCQILRSVYQCADTAIEALVEGMLGNGAVSDRITAKMVGGARMFSSYGNGTADKSIGEQNFSAVRRILVMNRIRLIASQVGGHSGRNVAFHLDSGRLIVKSIDMEDQEI